MSRMHVAAVTSNEQVMACIYRKELISVGASNRLHGTALLYGRKFDYVKAAQLVLGYDADVNVQDQKSETVLYKAACGRSC